MNRCIHIYERNIGCCFFQRPQIQIDKSILEYFSLEVIMITMCEHRYIRFQESIINSEPLLFYSNARLSPLYCCCSSCLILIQRENNCQRNLRNRLTFLHCEIFFRTSGGRGRNDVVALASNIIPDPVLPYFCLLPLKGARFKGIILVDE